MQSFVSLFPVASLFVNMTQFLQILVCKWMAKSFGVVRVGLNWNGKNEKINDNFDQKYGHAPIDKHSGTFKKGI